jgi:hypothetical protein
MVIEPTTLEERSNPGAFARDGFTGFLSPDSEKDGG